MKKLTGLVILILIMSIVLTACGQSAASNPAPAQKFGTAAPSAASTAAAAKPQSGGTLKIIVPDGGVTQLGSPADGTQSTAYTKNAQPSLEFLFRMDTNERLVPVLAESWDIAPDGKSITFHLRKGVKFQDGTDFNAAAVKYDLQNGPPGNVLGNVSSIDILDDHTLRLNLTRFDATLLLQLSYTSTGLIASPTAIQKATTPANMAKDHLVGTGPYKFVSCQLDINVKYEKFSGYWQKGRPYLDAIEIDQIADAATALISFKTGAAQVTTNISPQNAKQLAALGSEIKGSDMAGLNCLYPDSANPDSPWANLKVRQAVEYAINKGEIANTLGSGYFEVINQLARSTDSRYNADVAARDYNPGKAKQLLADAGYPNGFKTSIYASTTTSKDMTAALQSDLKNVGIDAEIQVGAPAKQTSLTQDGWKNGLLVANPAPVGDLPGFTRNFGAVGPGGAGTFNKSMLRPENLPKALDAVVAQTDANLRILQMKAIMKLISDQAIAVPLWASPQLNALDKSVQDLGWQKGHPNSWNPTDTWLSK
jgi:peptide/nickel transport system substrate-binding protein